MSYKFAVQSREEVKDDRPYSSAIDTGGEYYGVVPETLGRAA
jgi:hypothetical protein